MNKKDDPIEYLQKADPILAPIIKLVGRLSWDSETDYFRSLIESIIGQQLSTKAAETIISRFNVLFKTHPYFPKDILKLDTEAIRGVGISYNKVSYIQDLSQRTLDKRLDLTNLSVLDDAEVMKQLTEVKGIDPWTAEMFMMFALGRDDVFSFGDQGLKNAIKKLYKLKSYPTQRQVLKISTKWKPYRTWACRYLWASLTL